MIEYVTTLKQYDCLLVKQPFGSFYACSIPARELLEICKPVRAEVLDEKVDNDPLELSPRKYKGTQRPLAKNRPEQIKQYIETGVSAFPNSIIIGANIDQSGFLIDSEERGWVFDNGKIIISQGSSKAAVIDGQHRLSGFELLPENHPALDSHLLCSIYLDIPITYHAQIFSIINSTQRKVNKNLIYQLYQVDLDSNKPQFWSPDVLSVYMARGLNSDEESKLKNRLVLAIEETEVADDWSISLSSVVESVLKFISESPSKDRDKFYSKVMEQCERSMLKPDSSIWRDLYRGGRDRVIYDRIKRLVNCVYDDRMVDTAYCSSIGFSALMDAFRVFIDKSGYDFDVAFTCIEESKNLVNYKKLPREKNSSTKAKMRDIMLYEFERADEHLCSSYKERSKGEYHFDVTGRISDYL